LTLILTIGTLHQMPVITTESLPNGTVGQAYGPVDLMATLGTGGYSWFATGLPAGLTLTTTGVLSGTPAAFGSFSVIVAVSSNGITSTGMLPLTIAPAVPPLTINARLLASGLVDQTYGAFQLTAFNGSGSYTWSATGLPAGITLSATGLLFGTPTVAGIFAVTITVTSGGSTASVTLPLTISAPSPLAIVTTSLPNGVVGQPYTQPYGNVILSATGGTYEYRFSATGLPPGLTLSSAGILSGTPSASGSYTVTVTVSDGENTTSAALSLTITTSPVLTITSVLLDSGTLNQGYGDTLFAINGSGSYTWSAAGLPPGITISAAGVLSGMPTAYGLFSVTVTVVSGGSTASQTFPLTIGVPQLYIISIALANGAVNELYSPLALLVAGGSGVYSWSATGLPAGLNISAAGVLNGTPLNAGSFFITLTVTSGGLSQSATLGLTIVATGPAQPVQIPGSGGGSEIVLTSTTVFTPYSQNLPASSGAPPYTWSVFGGALPNGLSLSGSGALSGTPSQAGNYDFTAKVTDASGGSASAIFLITIEPRALSFIEAPTLPNGIAGSDYPPQIIVPTGGNPLYRYSVTTGSLPPGLTYSSGEISGTPTASGTFSFGVSASDSSFPVQTSSVQLQITIEPAHAELILSQTSLSFSLNTGATGVPAGATVTIRSSVSAQILNYSVALSPAASWLDVTGGGTTPGIIGVNLDPTALSMGVGASTTSIIVTCLAPGPCAGNAQTIVVSLTVASAPPELAVTSSVLSFQIQTSSTQTVSQTLGFQNVGGGTITVNSIFAADSFVTFDGVPSTLTAGSPASVTVSANPAGLKAGFYQSSILVNTSAGSVSVPVTLLLAQNAAMTLNPAGTQFHASAGSMPGDSGGSFLVSVSGNTTVNWAALLLPGANWLTLNTSGGSSTSANPGVVSFSISPRAASLAAASYYAIIQVSSSGVADSPEAFLVVLNVAPAPSPVMPAPQPAGLLFTAKGAAPPSQAVQVYASSTAPVSYQASSDSAWLSVSPSTGLTSSASPGSSAISTNPSGLAPGVYHGNVSYAIQSAAVPAVNVTLIVEGVGVSCVPAHLAVAQTGLVNDFVQAAGGPSSVTVLVVNDCGQPVTNGQITATFSNGDPPLALNPTDIVTGANSNTWTAVNIDQQTTITINATAPGLSATSIQITGVVTPGFAPILTQNGTLNAFAIAAEPGVPLAPGTIVQIYGANLAAQTTSASMIPLPTSLSQTSVTVGGLQAPLYYVSSGQINAQIPFELAAGSIYQLYVNANGMTSTPIPIPLATDSPGIAQHAPGQIIAQHADGSLITATSPAAPSEVIVAYVVGMGLTGQTVSSGTASPAANALDTPTLTLNGAPVTNIIYAGLTPTLVGLYQMNFQVPTSAPNGNLQLVVTQASGVSASAILPVSDSFGHLIGRF
jgi:uncharacterized protein (TIGR03437 family)